MKKLLFILPLLYYSCTDEIISDIDSILTENAEQDAQIDSLMTVLTQQQAYIDSLNDAQNIADSLDNLTMQSYIDSLINAGNISDSLLRVYTDSLNTVQNTLNTDQQAYIDSLINAGIITTKEFNAILNTESENIDISQYVDLKSGLYILEVLNGTLDVIEYSGDCQVRYELQSSYGNFALFGNSMLGSSIAVYGYTALLFSFENPILEMIENDVSGTGAGCSSMEANIIFRVSGKF